METSKKPRAPCDGCSANEEQPVETVPDFRSMVKGVLLLCPCSMTGKSSIRKTDSPALKPAVDRKRTPLYGILWNFLHSLFGAITTRAFPSRVLVGFWILDK